MEGPHYNTIELRETISHTSPWIYALSPHFTDWEIVVNIIFFCHTIFMYILCLCYLSSSSSVYIDPCTNVWRKLPLSGPYHLELRCVNLTLLSQFSQNLLHPIGARFPFSFPIPSTLLQSLSVKEIVLISLYKVYISAK